MTRRFAQAVAAAALVSLAGTAGAYTSAFTLDNTTAGAAGWSDPVNGATTFATGETTPSDSPAYGTPPTAIDGAFFRMGRAAGDNFGVALGVYDGTAGGSTGDPTDYEITSDVFISVDPANAAQRYHVGLSARWVLAEGNFPLQVFYSHNTPGQPNGYGFRGADGATPASQYGTFPAETSSKWVRMRLRVVTAGVGTDVTIGIDTNRDGTEEHTLNFNAPSLIAAGKAGTFSVINDPGNGSAGVANQFAYFDNFTFSPITSVPDWMLY